MRHKFTNNFSEVNVYKKQSKNSEIVSQIIYGQSFVILKKTKKWLKIRVWDDGYKGFVSNKKYSKEIKPTHKISTLKANVYKEANKKIKIGQLTFGSRIKAKLNKNGFVKFNKKWIEAKNLKPNDFEEKNIFQNLNIFKGVKYKWGGKSFKGIDCSGLVQIFFNYSNKFCPRDARDQIKYFKKKDKFKKLKKYDLLFWKGHVAIILSKKKLIHAYGPKKKTVVMNISNTIKLIEKTANLKLLSINRIN